MNSQCHRAGRRRVGPVPAMLILALLPPLGVGCGRVNHPTDGSPIVAPDSEAGRKGLAEAAALLQLRQRQEASRNRAFSVPEG